MSRSLGLPEELRFNISEYGQVFNVTPQYIQREVANLDPNFNWAGELMLEWFRREDELYQILGSVLESVPSGSLSHVRMVRHPSSGDTALFIPGHSMSDLERRRVMDSATLLDSRSQLLNNGSIVIPVDLELYGADLRGAMYLAHPRTNPDMGDRTILDISMKPSRIGTLSNLYSREMNYTMPQDLPAKFPQFFRSNPTDTQIIQAILQLNPGYNVGDLLGWLEYRAQVCEHVQSNGLDVLSSIDRIDFIDHISSDRYTLRMYVSKSGLDLVENYLERLGIEYTINNNYSPEVSYIRMTPDIPRIVRSTSQGSYDVFSHNVVRSIVSDWLNVRMCNTSYTPDMEEVYNPHDA